MDLKLVMGIDVGASGIKGGIVDTSTGEMLTERLKVATPMPSTPMAMARAFKELVNMHQWKDGLIGVGFPSIVIDGVALSAANIDAQWIGTNIEKVFGDVTGCPVVAVNDADAAGIAEVQFGVGKDEKGTVILITIGSGLGSAVFTDGHLVRNTEFGHFILKGKVAEHYASDKARQEEKLSWEEWGERFNRYLLHLNRLMSPNVIILGGGTSKKYDKFSAQITLNVPIKIANYRNKAGAIGAAIYASQEMRKRSDTTKAEFVK
jgi:polyphosphate glucokinase